VKKIMRIKEMFLRFFKTALGVCLLQAAYGVCLVLAGCQQKMADQPSFQPLEPFGFFADNRSSRPLSRGTVARGQLQLDSAVYTGRKTWGGRNVAMGEPAPKPGSEQAKKFDENRDFVEEFPVAINEDFIRHGRDRFSIYCVVCHDALGTGRGKIVERGYTKPPSYHIPRLREAPVGRLFAVVSEGYGSMPSYAGQIPVEDRWAIVAYVRALQASQHFPVAELNDKQREEVQLAKSP
jgi:mono/diheme cytochrome c family protein